MMYGGPSLNEIDHIDCRGVYFVPNIFSILLKCINKSMMYLFTKVTNLLSLSQNE